MSLSLRNHLSCSINYFMKITEASLLLCGIAQESISEEKALQRNMEEKAKGFLVSGAEFYAKARSTNTLINPPKIRHP